MPAPILLSSFTYAPKDRSRWLGATDIVALAGLSHWRSPITVWREKIAGLNHPSAEPPSLDTPPDDPGERVLLELGAHVEPFIARYYEQKTSTLTLRTSPIAHPNKSYWACSPDYLVVPAEEKKTVLHGLETKLVLFGGTRADELDTWGDEGTDQIPQDYLVQCQWSLNVTGLSRWDLAVLWYGAQVRYYTIIRQEALIARLRQIAEDFWINNVMAEKPPAPDGTQDYSRYLAQIPPPRERPAEYDLDTDPAYQSDAEHLADDAELLENCRELNETVKACETAKNLAWQRFALRFGAYANVRFHGRQWSVRTQTREQKDWKAIATHLAGDRSIPADILAAHTTRSAPYLVPTIRALKK